ncbi:MAG: hypothetical protein QM770_02780 [Tepidisphaeraceae bacterium]
MKASSDIRQLTIAYLQYAERHKGTLLPGYLPSGAPGVWDPKTQQLIGPPSFVVSQRRWPLRLAQFSPDIWRLIRPQSDVLYEFRRGVSGYETMTTYPVFGLNAVFLGGYDSTVKDPTLGSLDTTGAPITTGRPAIFKLSQVRKPTQQIVFVETRIADNGKPAQLVDSNGEILGFHNVMPPRAGGQRWTAGAKNTITVIERSISVGQPYSRAAG